MTKLEACGDDVGGNRFGRLFCSLIGTFFSFGPIAQRGCSKGKKEKTFQQNLEYSYWESLC